MNCKNPWRSLTSSATIALAAEVPPAARIFFSPHAVMEFQQEFYLGFTRLTPATNRGVFKYVPDTLKIQSTQVDAASGYAGSCHVLEMGRHYSEYTRYRGQFPRFPRVAGFPRSHYLRRLSTKARASNITGNIGEIVGGLVAERTLGIDPGGIAHLKESNSARTPDYLLFSTTDFETVLTEIVPRLAAAGAPALPVWWPMESKARRGGVSAAVREGLKQLAVYWYRTRRGRARRAGFGIVVGTELERPRRVCVHVFAPDDQQGLLDHLRAQADYDSFRASLDSNLTATSRFLMSRA